MESHIDRSLILRMGKQGITEGESCGSDSVLGINVRPFMWELIKEFSRFLRQEKKWWLVPLAVVLLLIAAMVIVSSSAAVAPFLYPFL